MRKIILKIWPVLFFVLLTTLFFLPVFNGKIPFPGDTLIGGYYPWREIHWQGKTTEYPLKNMTISDVTSSLYPWRYLAIKQIKEGKIPLWNDYEFSGTPLLANPYAAVFYPLNILFFIFSFPKAWTILIIIQPFLAGVFFYYFLLNKKFSDKASLFGAICFSFGSYFLNLTEFNMIGHTSLWIPLVLLAVDKFIKEKRIFWYGIIVFSLTMSLLAGFVQFMIFGYVLVFVYSCYQLLLEKPKQLRTLLIIFSAMLLPIILCAIQLIPFLELLVQSGRINAYGNSSLFTNFFIPAKQLTMFLAPDYFGNPATANYWGKINYFEFSGYLGIIPLVFIVLLIFLKKIKGELKFWFFVSLVSLFLAINNPISSLPYVLNIPFLSAFIPARLLFFTTFGFSILAAAGADHFCNLFNTKRKNELSQVFLLSWGILFGIIIFLFMKAALSEILGRDNQYAIIIMRNLFFPELFLGLLIIFYFIFLRLPKKFSKLFFITITLILIFDLLRQGRKFITFFDENLLYPITSTTTFLKSNLGNSRFMPLHQEIFGTNHQTVYGLEGIEGFGAYYNNLYGTFVSLGQGYTPQDGFITHFERTVFGRNYQANIFKLLSVKYFLSLNEIKSSDYLLVFQEGRTKIYENNNVLSRVFLSCNTVKLSNPDKTMKRIELLVNPAETVFTAEELSFKCQPGENLGKAKMIEYTSGKMVINFDAPGKRILVTGDIYYPGWNVYVDDKKEKLLQIDYALRGAAVPAGKHKVKFIYEPKSFRIGLRITLAAIVIMAIASGLIIIKRRKR